MERTTHGPSFLDLPAYHNVDVYDILHFNLEKSTTKDYALNDLTTGAGTLLVSKVTDALQRWDANGTNYGDDDAAKVAGLVERNLYTVHSAQVRDEVDKRVHAEDLDRECAVTIDVPRLTVELMLNGLFDREVKRDGVVNVNSNEPVLLINFDGDATDDATRKRNVAHYTVDIVGTEVREKWNIWPVRVYAGAFLGSSSLGERKDGGEDDGLGFSITLLNVVNTDIGGPSMPQLLDADCHAPEWNAFMRREVWRGRDLVSRDDGAGFLAPAGDDASFRSFASADEDDADSVGSDALMHPGGAEGEGELEGRVAGEDEVHQQDVFDDIQEGDMQPSARDHPLPVADLEDKGSDSQEPAEASAQEHEIQQELSLPDRRIEHPSWSRHDDSMSLLDLIKSQASRIAPFGTETVESGAADVEENPTEVDVEPVGKSERSETAAVEDKLPEARSRSEDEFVLL